VLKMQRVRSIWKLHETGIGGSGKPISEYPIKACNKQISVVSDPKKKEKIYEAQGKIARKNKVKDQGVSSITAQQGGAVDD